MPAKARHVVLETSFGDGARFLARLAVHRARGAAGAASAFAAPALHYIAHAAVLPALSELAPSGDGVPPDLRAAWPVAVPGLHRLALEGDVTLDLLVGGTVSDWLQELSARVDEFIIAEPLEAMRGLSRLAAPGATMRLHAPDEAQLRALKAAGFTAAGADSAHSAPLPSATSTTTSVAGRAPDGWVHASYTSRKPQPPAPAQPERRAIVIGAGVAGAAACERLAARGWEVTLVERHEEPAQEASGNRAGIFMPLLSKDDNIPTRLTRAAYLHAMRAWQRLGGLAPDGSAPVLGEQCGVLQLARDEEHAALQQEVAAAWQYPREFVQWLDAAAAGRLLGNDTPYGAWLFGQGGWANPASVCQAMLAACGERLTRVFHAEAIALQRAEAPGEQQPVAPQDAAHVASRAGQHGQGGQGGKGGKGGQGGQGGHWQVVAADGRVLASAPVVVLANGAGATRVEQASELPLYTMRGQVTHIPAEAFPQLPMVVCREAYMTPPVQGITSVGATYDRDEDRALRADSQQENLARAEEILGAARIAASRASYPASVPGGAGGARGRSDTGSPGDTGNHSDTGSYGDTGTPGDAGTVALAGRVGFRTMAPDRLPLVGALPDYQAQGRAERLRDVQRHEGLYTLLGYASRGLIWAPLAAELLASQLEHQPLPLETTLVAALDPARFLIKARRKL